MPSPTPSRATVPPAVWATYHYDRARRGYLAGTPVYHRVASTWTSPTLDAKVYASPLVVNGLVITATENNTIYALNEATGRIVWWIHLARPADSSALGCGNISPVSGITGTPVLDPAAQRIYAAGLVQASSGAPLQWQLFTVGLDGKQKLAPRPLNPAGLDPRYEGERGALALHGGYVYVPFGGLYGDCGNYHPYVLAVPAAGGAFHTYQPQAPGQNEAGIWAPSGVAEDDATGDVYATTGNGSAGCGQAYDHSEAVIKLSPTATELRHWTASDWCSLNQGDTDIGSIGPTVLPGGVIFQGGKAGIGYLIRTSDMALLHNADLGCGGIFGGTAYFSGRVYVPCNSGGIVALAVSSSTFSVSWRSGQSFAGGAPIVAGGCVWALAQNGGTLYGFDPGSGATRFAISIGSSSRFATPAADGSRLFVPLNQSIESIAFS